MVNLHFVIPSMYPRQDDLHRYVKLKGICKEHRQGHHNLDQCRQAEKNQNIFIYSFNTDLQKHHTCFNYYFKNLQLPHRQVKRNTASDVLKYLHVSKESQQVNHFRRESSNYLSIFQVAEKPNCDIKARNHHHACVQNSIPPLRGIM